jgi:hypothetical protein
MKAVSTFFTALFICLLGSTISYGSNYSIPVHTVRITKVDSAGDVLLIHVTNLTKADLNIHWQMISNSISNTGWSYQFCDLNTCYTSTAAIPYATNNLVDPSASSAYNLTILHYNHILASGLIKIALWDVKDPATVDTILFVIDATRLGVENNVVPAVSVSLFPNPATGYINLGMATNGFAPVKAVVFNAFGQQVASQNISADVTRLDVDALAKGMYIIRIEDKSGREAIKQFVKE